jgi:hypothetical protein
MTIERQADKDCRQQLTGNGDWDEPDEGIQLGSANRRGDGVAGLLEAQQITNGLGGLNRAGLSPSLPKSVKYHYGPVRNPRASHTCWQCTGKR